MTPERSLPNLEETRTVSLLVPAETGEWTDVERTFMVEKLAPDCANRQLHETLPLLPESLIKKEAETKERLTRSMGVQTFLEAMMHNQGQDKIFAVLSKMNTWSFMRDLEAFMKARRACRKHVLQSARVRHEPEESIDSSY